MEIGEQRLDGGGVAWVGLCQFFHGVFIQEQASPLIGEAEVGGKDDFWGRRMDDGVAGVGIGRRVGGRDGDEGDAIEG